MLMDMLLFTLFLGMILLFCWLGFKASFPHQDRRTDRSNRHRTSQRRPSDDDDSTCITPPPWPPAL